MRLAIVTMVLWVQTASAKPAPWKITPPTGWIDQTAEKMALPEVREQQATLSSGGATAEQAYFGLGENALAVIYVTMPAADANATGLRNFEAGARDGFKKSATEVSYKQTDEADAIVVAVTATVNGRSLYVRRISGVRDGRIVSVSATCVAVATSCEPALASLAIDRTGFAPLVELSVVDEDSSAYQAGKVTAYLVIAGLLAWALWATLRRKR